MTKKRFDSKIIKLYEIFRQHSIVHGGAVGLACYALKLIKKNKLKVLLENISDAMSDGFNYQLWIKKYEFDSSQNEMAKEFEKINIAIIILANKKNIRFLKKSVESVIGQAYKNWTLYVVGDSCLSDNKKNNLREVAGESGHDVFFVTRPHVNDAVNECIESLKEDWVVFLEGADLLNRTALVHLARECISNKNILFAYSDHDFLDEDGGRASPEFKPDWNPDLLISKNYILNMSAYDLKLLKGRDCYRNGYEGAQDYDLLLRVLLGLDADSIIHIPRVLYHKRKIDAGDDDERWIDNGLKSLTDNLKFYKKNVLVRHGRIKGSYKVDWLLGACPFVSLVMPVKNSYQLTKQAIESIFNKTNYLNYEIIIVDNNSDDEQILEYFDCLKRRENVQVIKYEKPFNFSAINNLAIKHSKGRVIGLVNNDIEVINDDWMIEMVSQAMRPEIGCVGALLYYPNNRVQHGGVIVGMGGVAGHAHKHFKRGSSGYTGRLAVVQNYSAVTAACLFVRKSIYMEVGGMNEEDLTVAFNDIDFCLKVMASGYRNLWTPFAELYHYESVTRGYENDEVKRSRFESEADYMRRKWGEIIANDHAYNPNLTLQQENFALSFPPRVDLS